MTPSLFVAIVVAVLLAAAALAWWTVRRLWRPATTPRDIWIYTLGVKRFGVLTGILMLGAQLARAYPHEHSLLQFAITALFSALTAITLFLWGGYWWGRTMAYLMGAPSAAVSPPNQRL